MVEIEAVSTYALHMMENHRQYIDWQAKIFKALGHPGRLLMVDALRDGEKCVSELQKLVGDDMSTISRHLAVLREAGIVSSEKKGVSIYYRLRLACLGNFLSCTASFIAQNIRDQATMLEQNQK